MLDEFMFCPNCGKGEQTPNQYCRNCGEFMPDLSGRTKRADMPDEQIKANLVLNLLGGIVSLVLAILLYARYLGKADATELIYFVAAFLLAMCGWQLTTFRINLKLKKHFDKRKKETTPDEPPEPAAAYRMSAAKTKDLLPEADFSAVVPASVTENTTKILREPIKNRSS